jgi:hypothetical protein
MRSSSLLVLPLVSTFVSSGVVLTSVVIISLMTVMPTTTMTVILVRVVIVVASISVHIEVTCLEVDRGQALLQGCGSLAYARICQSFDDWDQDVSV